MSDFNIADNYIPPVTEACSGSTLTPGIYYAMPPFGTSQPLEGDPQYEMLPFSVDDQTGFKILGFRGRNIAAQLVIIADSPEAAQDLKNALEDDIKDPTQRFVCAVPGGRLREGCKLLPGGFIETGWESVGFKHVLFVSFACRSYVE